MKKNILGAVLCFTLGGLASLAFAERQPEMKKALVNLEQAHKNLELATADKGGHRVKAMELTKAAMEEVKAGIEFDNKH